MRDHDPCNMPVRFVRGLSVYNSTVRECQWADETKCEDKFEGKVEL